MRIELNAGYTTFLPLAVTEVNLPERVTFLAHSHAEHLVLTVQSKIGVRKYDADGEIDITEMCETDGYVVMALSGYIGGKKIGDWQIEKLHINTDNQDLKAQPFADRTDERLAHLEEENETLKSAIKELYTIMN